MQVGGMLWPFQGGGKICSQDICHYATYHSVFEFHRKSRNPKRDVIATFCTGSTLLGDRMMGFMERHYFSFNSRMSLLVEYYISLAMKFHGDGT